MNMHNKKVIHALQQNETPSSLEVFNQFVADLEMYERIVSFLLEKLNGTSKLVFRTCPREIEAAHGLPISVIPHARASS